MKKTILRTLFLLSLVSAAYAGVNTLTEGTGTAEPEQKKADEPVEKFVPSEKLRADDAIAFPVDI